MPDLDAIAVAIAARFAPGQLTAPVGYATIRASTANPIAQITVTPVVMVTANEGEFDTGNGTRMGLQSWWVRFYLDQVGDTERAEVALRKWATVLIDQLKASVQLGGTVARATVDSYKIGILTTLGGDYWGIELVVSTTTTEGWAAVA